MKNTQELQKAFDLIDETMLEISKSFKELESDSAAAIRPTEDKPAYEIAVDWCWITDDPPKDLRCLYFVITGDGPAPKMRGMATATQCVRNAIEAYRNNRLEGAINWLCAGQCHNPSAQNDIRAAGVSAPQYAEQNYGT